MALDNKQTGSPTMQDQSSREASPERHSIEKPQSIHENYGVQRASSDIDEKKLAPVQSAQPVYPGWKTLLPIIVSIYMTFFLIALDKTIIGVAIPKITDQFDSLNDIGWYGSSYLLTTAATQLVFGKIYQFYSPKTVYLICIVVFELGSAISGAAPNSGALIAGRAISGLGASGMQNGSVIIFMHIVPLHRQPIFQGLMGMVFGISSVLGPLLGGVFTDHLSWRWCFYINLPIGGVAFVVIFFIMKLDIQRPAKLTIPQQLLKLDPIGNAFFVPGIVCLLLALQWGGGSYPWSNPRIIALLVLAPILLITFIVSQCILGERAMVPLRIVRQRSIAASTLFAFCVGGLMIVVIYYLPLWFQAIKGASAQKSGFMQIPTILSMVVASVLGGVAIKNIGYYAPFMIATSVLTAIGAGLLSTLNPASGHPQWIGYQFIFGFGLGLGMQQSATAVRASLSKKDVSIGVACVFFCMTLGQALFLAVAQSIFQSQFRSKLSAMTGFDVAAVIGSGATEFRQIVPVQKLPAVLEAYSESVTNTFYIPVAVACLSIVGSGCVEWKNIKLAEKPKEAKGMAEA
ncbi:MFS general substrate transporter [Pseudovirgaria hyperparasitica]|uniref:MFS general substrate transporter n=1 Tax=Pseudovirgaria hyperparasitica TaxID=470096 RepID=A0A6A6WA44_9PEZI|nr:MFS general substrate transporter [Pseudovirgaria hyperparasitica]KAF2758457.1 MFS general substrate transporter [Pseudovirgaria hyperparasitica]